MSVALTLVPFAGIAFLWFMGVVRAHLGRLEDQFFSSVLVGSGLLFLAMTFVASAIAGGVAGGLCRRRSQLTASGVLIFGRALMYMIMNVYAIRMAGVFMISLGTIWFNRRSDAPVCVYHLRPGAAAVGYHQFLAVDGSDLSRLGFCHQRVYRT